MLLRFNIRAKKRTIIDFNYLDKLFATFMNLLLRLKLIKIIISYGKLSFDKLSLQLL